MFDIEAIKQLLQAAQHGWRGCDWHTSFGPKKLDLCGIRSRQARLVAKATRGDESQCWCEAVRWLTAVESDASDAAELAAYAIAKAQQNAWPEACELLRKAEGLESKYGQTSGYREVREAFDRFSASETTPA
jgi:hypothetical protein